MKQRITFASELGGFEFDRRDDETLDHFLERVKSSILLITWTKPREEAK